MNYVVEYWKEIAAGEVVVSQKVFKLYKRLAADIRDETSKWQFDEARANRPIEFIERFCKHSKGEYAGKPVILELWQKALIAAAFGFIVKATGRRRFRRVDLYVGRKNGKSTLAAGLGLYMETADGESGAEVYSLATKRDQSKIIWLEAKRMIKQSEALRKRIRTLVGELAFDKTFSTFMPLSSDSNTLDGLNTYCGLVDELHAIKDKNLIDVIVDSMSSRVNPMLFVTTTMGTVREGVFDATYEYDSKVIDWHDGFQDEEVLAVVYELDKREEWTDPKCWQKANPGLGTIKDVAALRSKVEKAKRAPAEVKNLLCKDFNVRETTTESWLSFEELNNEATFDPKELGLRYGIGGADLSETTDLTAAKVIAMRPNDSMVYVFQMYWLPEDLLDLRVKEDKIPYDVWAERGLLRTTPGNRVHHKYVTEWFLEIQNEYGIYLPWIGYDRYSAIYWVEEMKGYFGAEALEAVAQGKATLSSPMKLLGADLSAKLVNYNNHPIDKWCLSNTAVDLDLKNQTIQPHKGNNQRRRIDGTAALLNAYVALERHRADYMNMI